MNEAQARALFTLAEIPITVAHELPNQYWPEAYVEERKASPWWLMETPHGGIRIGWRKRVIHIDWRGTSLRKVITDDDVTKGEEMVHAYGYVKALEHLIAVRRALESK